MFSTCLYEASAYTKRRKSYWCVFCRPQAGVAPNQNSAAPHPVAAAQAQAQRLSVAYNNLGGILKMQVHPCTLSFGYVLLQLHKARLTQAAWCVRNPLCRAWVLEYGHLPL